VFDNDFSMIANTRQNPVNREKPLHAVQFFDHKIFYCSNKLYICSRFLFAKRQFSEY